MILIVEDDGHMREVIEASLTECNFYCETASSVLAALQKLCQKLPDILIADLMLLDGDAREIITYCRGHSPGIKIIIISALTPFEVERLLKGVSVDHVIHKPFTFDTLESAIYSCRSNVH